MDISVVIPTYNRASVLERAISSVWAQTQRAKELIIVDDASTDSTEEQVQHLISKAPLPTRYFKLSQNKGVSYARNYAIQRAKGHWIALLDSDDEWLPDKLEKQIQVLNKTPELLFVHGEEIWIRNGVRVNPMKKHSKFGGYIFNKCLPLCCISPSASLFHKKLWQEFGGFDESYPVCEDYDLWLKVCAKYPVGFVKTPVLKKYGGHKDQLSQKLKAMDYWRVKSLFKCLDNPQIKEFFPDIHKEIQKKSEVLLKGYKKHGNLTNYDEVRQIYLSVLSDS